MAITFDPLSPDTASSSSSVKKDKSTFKALTRERQFRHPPSTSSDVPALDELVAPHIESFNALIEDEGVGKGLLQLGVEDLGEKVVFDGVGSGEDGGLGNKISCEFGYMLSGHGSGWLRRGSGSVVCFASVVCVVARPLRGGGGPGAERCWPVPPPLSPFHFQLQATFVGREISSSSSCDDRLVE